MRRYDILPVTRLVHQLIYLGVIHRDLKPADVRLAQMGVRLKAVNAS